MKHFSALLFCAVASLFVSICLPAQTIADENHIFDKDHVGPVKIGDNSKDAAAKLKALFPVVKIEYDGNKECNAVNCYDKKNRLQLTFYCGPHNLSTKETIEEYRIYSTDFVSSDGFSLNSTVGELLKTGRWFVVMDCAFILVGEEVYFYIPNASLTEDDITAPATSKPTVISNMPWN